MKNLLLLKLINVNIFFKTACVFFFNNSIVHLFNYTLSSNERKQACSWKDGHLNYQKRKQYHQPNFIFRNVHVACKRSPV